MNEYLNKTRPPVFCPGCTHEKITKGLDQAMARLNLVPEKTVIVTDIGCSGLFDTFFNVHALHGIHGRALTYASGLKLADPELNVIVTMGDGGLGIGGAHVLASCRKNLDLTLIILNNFNFGMTGGQYSATTPTDAVVGSEFLNRAEQPMDICEIARSAGAGYITKCSGHDTQLAGKIADAIEYKGFSIIETLGMCTGRYTKKNQLTPKMIDQIIGDPPEWSGMIKENQRNEYGETYKTFARKTKPAPKQVTIEKQIDIKDYERQEIVILGSAGMRIVTAGDIVCYAGLYAGMNVSIKNDYNITVLRGQSVSEILISPEKIGHTGIKSPTIVLALSDEGVQRRKQLFSMLHPDAFVLREKSITIPETNARVFDIDFKALKIRKQDWALAGLGILAKHKKAINREMLQKALAHKFNENILANATTIIEKVI